MSKKLKTESTLYYFYSTGCGFCKKVDPIVEKLNKAGKDILLLDLNEPDNKGLKKELEKEYDTSCGTPFLVDASNGNSICGWKDEETIKKWADGEEIPKPPKPKSPAPPLPKDFDNKKQINKFTKQYNKWKNENNHIPNLQTSEQIIERIKQQLKTQKNQQQSLDGRVTSIEQKLDRLMNHLGVK